MLVHIFIYVALIFKTSSSTELFLTASEMKDLLNFEKELADDFLELYKKETKRLDGIEKKLNYIEMISKKEKSIAASHMTDSYKLLDRFQNEWEELDWLFTPESTKKRIDHIKYFTDKINSFGKSEELRGSIHTILRLQDAYNISSKTMAQGLAEPVHKLTNEDLHEIAMYASHFYNYKQAKEWAQYNIELNPSIDNDIPMGKWNLSDVYDILAWASYKTRDYSGAFEATKISIKLKPTALKKQNLLWYHTFMVNGDGGMNPAPEVLEQDDDSEYNKTHQVITCQGGQSLDPAIKSTLFCNNYIPHPQFYLKPLKQEQLFHNPKIVKYHDILLESEIQRLKESAKLKLDTARVYRMDNGKLSTANYRISKNAWLNPMYDKVVQNIVNRVGALGNFDMAYSEPLQVANYGVGGNYESHVDHATPPHNSSIFGAYDFGNRIATMLFYLETVDRGGDTAFLRLPPGVAAKAVKGSGVFWHNLKKNGEGNPLTRHAACPVLLGEKWVSNLWIHEHGQEFRHPCSLDRNE